MEAGLDDPTLLRSYPLASLTELRLCESTTLTMGSTVLGIAVSIYCPYRCVGFLPPLLLPPTSTGNMPGVREEKSSAVPTLQTMTEEKRKCASETTPLTDEFAVPVVKSSGDERKSLSASSSSTQNSEFQSDVSSSVKPQQMGVRSEVGGFLRAELPSNAGSSELSSHQILVRRSSAQVPL